MADKQKSSTNQRGGAAGTIQGKQAASQSSGAAKKLYGADQLNQDVAGGSQSHGMRRDQQKKRLDQQIDSRSSQNQAPSNNQSAGGEHPGSAGQGALNAGSHDHMIPFLNIDFKLTNEPTQFNCFMNSIVQAVWHCKPANDALKEVKEWRQQTITNVGGNVRAQDIRNRKEYQLVAHLQGLFEEAQQSHTVLRESLKLHQSESEAQSAGAGSTQSSTVKSSKTPKSQSKQAPIEQQDVLEAQDPLISPDLLRRELFKLYYATQNPEKFDLYKKADASEFLQSLLEMIHFCLNRNQTKENIDSFCGQLSSNSESKVKQGRPCPNSSCLIHQKMFQNVFVVKSCPCSPEKQPVQEYHQNNFMYIVNAQEVIDMQGQMLKAQKKNGRKFRKCELEIIASKLVQFCKAIHDRTEGKCEMGGGSSDVQPSEGGVKQAVASKGSSQSQSGAKCKYKQTQYTHCIKAPFPEVLALNVNWFDNQVAYMDTLRFCSAIPQRLRLDELYQVVESEAQDQDGRGFQDSAKDDYVLRSVVCFLGAHYMTYVKQINTTANKDGTFDYDPVWKLYDDYKAITTYQSWKDILEKILEYGTLPTVLVYERVPQHCAWSPAYDIYDRLNPDDLYQLYKRAQSFQQFYDQIEVLQAQNEVKANKEQEKKKPAVTTGSKGGVVPDPQQKSVNVPMKKTETEILKELYLVKQKYKPYNIYIYECIGCSLFMMLHQRACPHCGRNNAYYDADLQIGQQIEQDVVKLLEGLQKELGMTNQALGNQIQAAGSVNSGVLAQKGADAQEAGMHGAVTTKNYEESDEDQLRQGHRARDENVRDQDIGVGGSANASDALELKSLKSKRGTKHDLQSVPGSTPASNQGHERNDANERGNKSGVSNSNQSQVEDDRTTNRESQDSNRTQDIDQGRKEPETDRPTEEPQMLTVWRCPKCNFYNAFGNSQQCMNSQIACHFDLGYIDDITKYIQQLTQEQYDKYLEVNGKQSVKNNNQDKQKPEVKNQDNQKKQPEQPQPEKKEEETMKEDEWLCDHCNAKNRMTSDRNSAICRKCKQRNQLVLWLIEAKQDQSQAKAEVRVLNHYKQQKTKPGGAQDQNRQQQANQQQAVSRRARHGTETNPRGRGPGVLPAGHGATDNGRTDTSKGSQQFNQPQGHHISSQQTPYGSDKSKSGGKELSNSNYQANANRAVPSSSSGGAAGQQSRPQTSGKSHPHQLGQKEPACPRCLTFQVLTEQGYTCLKCLQVDQKRKQETEAAAAAQRPHRDRANTFQPQMNMQAISDPNKRINQQRPNLQQTMPQSASSKAKIANITALDPSYGTDRMRDQLNLHQNANSSGTQQQMRQIEDIYRQTMQKQPSSGSYNRSSQAQPQRYQQVQRQQDVNYLRQSQQHLDQAAYYNNGARGQQPKAGQQQYQPGHTIGGPPHQDIRFHPELSTSNASTPSHASTYHYSDQRHMQHPASGMPHGDPSGYNASKPSRQQPNPPQASHQHHPQYVQSRGGAIYQAHQQQQQYGDSDDEKYERRGEFYQCIKCEQYTVHVSNDHVCRNPGCPSNEHKRRQQQYSNKSSQKQFPMQGSHKSKSRGTVGTTSTKKTYCGICNKEIRYEEYKTSQGQCQSCFKRSQARNHANKR